MKKLLVFVAAVMIAGLSYAQKVNDSEVPSNVKAKMATSFPDAKSVKWSKEDGSYEAEFKLNNTEMSCNLNAAGELLETETEIAVKDLPVSVKSSIERDFAGSKIKEAAKIEKNGVLTFEAEVKIGEDSYDLIYDANGKLVHKIKLTEEDEEKD